ncbi:MAG: zinc-ribbon domain-containing protein [Smithellaceae bacterium]|nr:zinc-ribbon domain-containing protein [Smithellaceae bacterium]
MIIQCKQCRTKFRFDDAQMEGNGLWVRCSLCQHVFFQDNPLEINASTVTPQSSPAFSQGTPPEKTAGRLSFEPAGTALGGSTLDEDITSFLEEVMVPEKSASDELRPKSKSAKQAGMNLTEIEFSPASESLDETGELQRASAEKPMPPARKKSRLWKIALWTLTILAIIVIPVIVCFVVFPQLSERYVQIAREYVDVSQYKDGRSVAGQVKLQDIRQRVINNYILGNIRIVEGTAVNQANFSIARIQVKAEMMDAYAIVLGERASYAGNVLTDEDLTNLSEEEILKRLSLPGGRDNSNERVISNGRIPFMIVFTREPPGYIKTTVMISGAERLL